MALFKDLYWLPPVRGKPANTFKQSVKGYIYIDLWEMIQFVKLNEVMTEIGNDLLIHIFNKIRVCVKLMKLLMSF